MWQHLRRNQVCGLKFSKQKPIGDYILDFYCHKIKLAIELDGDQHFYDRGKIKDRKRSDALEKLGIMILRFPNNEIYKNKEAVLERIFMVVDERLQKIQNLPNPPLKRRGKFLVLES